MNVRILHIPLTIITLCLASCSSSSQDESDMPSPPAPNPDLTSIGFGGNSGAWQDAPSSRATDNGLENLFKSFRVWGYKTTNNTPQTVMDGYNVEYKENTEGSTTSNAANWEYIGINNSSSQTSQTIKYWDYSASDYRFFAYAPEDVNITSSKTSSTDASTSSTEDNSQLAFSIPYTYSDNATTTTTPYVSDLWYSDNSTTVNKYGNTVKLTFAPIIAKVRFKFKYPDGIKTAKITNIKFRDNRQESDNSWAKFPKKGNIKAAYSLSGSFSSDPIITWITSSDIDARGVLILDTPYEDESDEIHQLTDETKYNKWYYLPPLGFSATKDDKPSSYTITAVINGKNSSATVDQEYMQWRGGYQYTYIFKITEAGDAITFSDLQVEEWKKDKNIDNNGSGTAGW